MQNIKVLPFKQIKPFKFIGIDNRLSFCSIISEGKLLYFCGRNIILENVKTLQQKIIWTNQLQEQPQLIEHICNTHRQNMLGIVEKDVSGTFMITIMNINSQINNYEHIDKRQRQKDRSHYLKMVPQDAKILNMKFILQGALFCIIYIKNNDSSSFIQIMSSYSGQTYYNCNINSQRVIVQPLQIFRAGYVCIIDNEPDQQLNQSYLNSHANIMTQKNILSFNKIQNVHKYKLTLLNATDLHSRSDFYLELQIGEYIILARFVQNHKKTFCFVLLSSGYILISTLTQYGFNNIVRVQIKINKKQYQLKQQKKKIQQKFNILRINSLIAKQNQIQQYQQSTFQISHERNHKQVHSSFCKQDSKEQKNKFYFPSTFAVTNNSIVFSYQNCSFVGVLTYSILDHQNYKFKYISDFLKDKDYVKSIKKIKFAQDGCHCCLLVSVHSGARKQQNSTHNEAIIQSKGRQNKSKQFRIKTLDYQSNLKAQIDRDKYPEQQIQWHQLYHMDFVSGLIQHQHRQDSIIESFSCKSVNGIVQNTIFNKINNSMFILLTCGTIKYYDLNADYNQIAQEKKVNNQLKCVKQQLSKNKSCAFKPESVLLWVQKLKNKPILIILHPIIFQIVLVFQQNIKFYYYNSQKLFQSHHTINIKNCKAGSYSIFGDKLALGLIGAVYIIDSYTHQISKKIPLVIFPNNVGNPQQKTNSNFKRTQSVYATLSSKTITKIQYLNNQDFLMQTSNTTLSMLANYQKVVYYGNTDVIHQNLVFYDNKHKLGIIANDSHVKIITKCGINTKNKCQELAKIDLSISAIKACGQVDTLFLGGTNGILYMLRWPDFFKSQTLKVNLNKVYLFQQPIVSIDVTLNYKYLIVISQRGLISLNQLVHSDQVQKIGKDISFVLMKKIDLPLPLINKWFISTSDQEKRAETLTKLMGNQAEVKNNFMFLSSQYETILQTKSKNQKLCLEDKLKTQIKKYEDDSGILKLQIQINFMVDQIKRISGKRQKQLSELNESIEGQLHQIFNNRTALQNQLQNLKINGQKSIQRSRLQQINQFKEYLEVTKQQIDQNAYSNQLNQKMYNKNMELNSIMSFNMEQEFQEDKQQIKNYFDAELVQIYYKNNLLTNQNRNLKVSTISLSDKIRQIIARTYQMQVDISQLLKEKQKVNTQKLDLVQKITENQKKYHYLIKKSKQYQKELTLERTLSDSVKSKHCLLEQQIQAFHQNIQFLQQKITQIQKQFLIQHQIQESTNAELFKIKTKMESRKKRRKQTFDNNVLIRNHLKLYYPELMSDSIQVQNIQKGNLLQTVKQQNGKKTLDVQKWNKLKQSNKQKMMFYQKRMNEQNNKLIYRFNQLKKQQQSLRKHQNQFKIKLLKQKNRTQDLKQKKQNIQKYSYHFNKAQIPKKQAIKSFSIKRTKMVCVSLHEGSNKFITEA